MVGENSGVDVCLANLEARLTADMNATLLRDFTSMEVEAALNQMHSLKSPGPDGFSACFYQQSWLIVKMKACKGCWVFSIMIFLMLISTQLILL